MPAKKIVWYEKILGIIISQNFKCELYIDNFTVNGNYNRVIKFFGRERDLELAREMYILAYDALRVHTEDYIADYYEESFTRIMIHIKIPTSLLIILAVLQLTVNLN